MGDVRFLRVAPVVPVRDLEAALDRYRRMGFDEPGETEYGLREFAFVDPDGTLDRVGSATAPL